MLLSRASMADALSSSGIDLPSPTLSVRFRELAGFLAAPTAGRLTEEQRALSLGIARRLVADVVAELGCNIDAAALWRDWLVAGVPAAGRLTTACFARAEEHRWRELSAQRFGGPAPAAETPGDAGDAVPSPEQTSDIDRAYLALQIADRRRFDGYGSPCLALFDIDADLLRVLLLDVSAWGLMQVGKDGALAASLGDAVRLALERHAEKRGIDRAAKLYHDQLADLGQVAEASATAIARHDWVALTALAAAAGRCTYADMALTLLSAETAALPQLLAPLKLDRAAFAPLEASLALLPARAVAGGGHDE